MFIESSHERPNLSADPPRVHFVFVNASSDGSFAYSRIKNVHCYSN